MKKISTIRIERFKQMQLIYLIINMIYNNLTNIIMISLNFKIKKKLVKIKICLWVINMMAILFHKLETICLIDIMITLTWTNKMIIFKLKEILVNKIIMLLKKRSIILIF
jgi:hypothetical protein